MHALGGPYRHITCKYSTPMYLCRQYISVYTFPGVDHIGILHVSTIHVHICVDMHDHVDARVHMRVHSSRTRGQASICLNMRGRILKLFFLFL